MYVEIDPNGVLSLKEETDFSRFSIVDRSSKAARDQLELVANAAEDDHYWIDTAAIIKLSSRGQDPTWIADFRAMLAGAERFGYADLANNLVKAHVEQDAS